MHPNIEILTIFEIAPLHKRVSDAKVVLFICKSENLFYKESRQQRKFTFILRTQYLFSLNHILCNFSERFN